jgi:N-acetylmuramoyl-L-alanine amidase
LERYPDAVVLGHRDFPDVVKTCPNFDVMKWMEAVGIKRKGQVDG